MIGEKFAEETGVKLLGDPSPLEIFGTRVLLSHGDALCTDDVEYQQVRAVTRDPQWQAMMRAKSIDERIAFASQARKNSLARSQSVDDKIGDVNQDEVVAIIRSNEVDVLLHGHTHRPAVHDVELGDRTATRIVLGDWYTQGSLLRWDANGPALENLER
jgi:UDP-2,3-diacylglucosamine hydrolase